MTKNEYLKEWALRIQKNIWERDVIIAMKKEKDPQDKDLDALNMNNEKDQALVDYISKYVEANN